MFTPFWRPRATDHSSARASRLSHKARPDGWFSPKMPAGSFSRDCPSADSEDAHEFAMIVWQIAIACVMGGRSRTCPYFGTKINRSIAIRALLSIRVLSRRKTTSSSLQVAGGTFGGTANSSVSITAVTCSFVRSGVGSHGGGPQALRSRAGIVVGKREQFQRNRAGVGIRIPEPHLHLAAAPQIDRLIQLLVRLHHERPMVRRVEGQRRRRALLEVRIRRRTTIQKPVHPILA